MPNDVTFESFEQELNRLVESFGKRLTELKKPGYAEAQLRDDFLNPMFRALGWDMENRAGLIQKEREVEIESATRIGGGRKRADYLFRTDKRDRFVCEAKKPAEQLHGRYAFQAKRYAWNKGVPVAVLTDFEELKIFIVGGKPDISEPQVGEWKSWRFHQYPLIARELWDLLARDKIAAGSIDQALDALPRKSTGTGKARQQWLIKPDRTRALDTDFLEFLDETRRDLASDIYSNNDHGELLEGNKLTEAVQRIIDRILFLRICEDRDIDTGERLQSIVKRWRKNTGDDLLADESDIALLPPLQDNIKCGNSLIASDFSMIPEDLVRVHAFDWPVQFASIMKGGGFDAVIGNPPYIRIQTMQESDAESVEYLNQNYLAAKTGNYDIYVCFVERGLRLINKEGTLGFILPHKFFNAQYGEGLREVISKGKHLRRIVHFGHQQVFEGATTYTCLMFLNKSPLLSFDFGSVGSLSEWHKTFISQEREITASDATASEWNFNAGADAGLIDHLFAMPVKLGDVAHLFVGLQTDADDVFIVEQVSKSANELVCFSKATEKEHVFEREHLKLLLKGSLNVRRYELDSVTKRLIFPYEMVGDSSVVISEKDYKKRFPKTWCYLEANKGRLSKRNKGKQPDGWYGYVYKKNHTRFGTPKIIVPSLGMGSCFALDSEGDYFFVGSGAGGGGGYGIVPINQEIGDIRFLLGLLNSRLLSFLIRKVSTPFRGGYIALNRQYIERLPIQLLNLKKATDKSRHDKLVLLVDKMLGLMPNLRAATSDSEKVVLHNAVTATDQQIDALVYELYGLTAGEIKLVEGQ